ncbi:hypothetical protein FJTKL_05864 [Diaporthe vaccinii]|uniref:YDG domain-containing protein n=1 Tax=Diaporthe vaccinii TaxID=105482 RepID=A0ABR4EY80_9PEZI
MHIKPGLKDKSDLYSSALPVPYIKCRVPPAQVQQLETTHNHIAASTLEHPNYFRKKTTRQYTILRLGQLSGRRSCSRPARSLHGNIVSDPRHHIAAETTAPATRIISQQQPPTSRHHPLLASFPPSSTARVLTQSKHEPVKLNNLTMAAQGQPTGANASTITYPKVARALIERVKWFEKERATIQHFAQASIKARGVPNLDSPKHREQIERTRGYLDLLEFDTSMSPELRNKTRIEDVLKLINRPKVYFPDDVKQRAEMLLQRFRDESWGAGAEAEDDNDSGHDDDEQAASPTTATAPAAPVGEPGSDTVTLRLPPTDHPIWGLEGIMHRIALTQGTNRYKIDPRYRPRPAKVSGDNGLAVGAWFPNQFSALVNGAHGAPVAGISGNVDYGAYSIVMAGAYKDVDEE